MKIAPKPSQPPAFDVNDPRYWDARDLEQEMRRAFEICHGCRMCVNYCGSFPDMFARVDRDIEKNGAEGAELTGAADFQSVTELCWQCKLCYVDCPYTPDQKHEWALDIPRLLTREKAQRAKRGGVTLQDRALGEPGKLGQLNAGPMAGMVNFVTSQSLLRKVQEKVLGISSEFPVPPFASVPYARWLKSHTPQEGAGSAGKVAMFATCLGDYNFPALAIDATRVLEKNGYAVERPDQVCCGIANLDGGDIDEATRKARTNVASLSKCLDEGMIIVVPGPSCAYTIKKEYPDLLGTKEAKRVAENTLDLMEFLDRLRKEKKLNREFKTGFGKVAYHAACHLRAQKIGTPGARLLGLLPDTEVEVIDKCSAVDGTWGMKAQHYEMGRKYAQKLVDGIENVEPKLVVSDCPLSAQRILKERGERPIHPVEALATAYGLGAA
jgi:glycerol-3-phosphate dehydrogenase subunit C